MLASAVFGMRRPRLLVVLAVFGLIVGVSGTWQSLDVAITRLQSRDQLVATARSLTEALAPLLPDGVVHSDGGVVVVPADGGTQDTDAATDGGVATSVPHPTSRTVVARDHTELLALSDAVADAIYARRVLDLLLAGMNVILSLLLFAAAARALRGLPSALSTWSWCVTLSIPYQLLDCAASLVESQEQLRAVDAVGASEVIAFAFRSQLELKMLGTILVTGFLLLYYAACWLYLRRAVKAV